MKSKAKAYFVAALLVSLLMCSAGFAVTKWACVGDSITAGWKLKEASTYCYKLGVLLGSEFETANFGHSARTMLRNPVEGWPYWESPLFIDSQSYSPDVVSIMLGTNDTHPNNWPELRDEYLQDAADLVRIYRNLPGTPRVILMTVPPVKEGNSRNPAISEANEDLRLVAGFTHCELADVWGAIDSSGLLEREKFKDPIHLDSPAHTVIAELLYDHYLYGGPYCGDGTCNGVENQCTCASDCNDPPSNEVSCVDGFDNDCDEFFDCDDADCYSDPYCSSCGDGFCETGEDSCSCSDDCDGPPAFEIDCNDGADEDCDGALDCADADCAGDAACLGGEVIFSDDFESGDLTAGGWTISGNSQIHEQAAFTGVYGVKLQKKGALLEKDLSTVGRTSVVLEYDRVTMNLEENDDSLEVEWYDGANWHLLESTADTSWGHASFELSLGAGSNSEFRIRFTLNCNHPIEKAYLDNVVISE
jgi:lysophospholipase L1-like esterase